MVFSDFEMTRRGVCATALFAACGAALGSGAARAQASNPTSPSGSQVQSGQPRPWYKPGIMQDPILDEVFLFYLGNTWQGLSDVAECYETAGRIVSGDEWSWAREWEKTAERLRANGVGCEHDGHFVSAGESFLRASNYYIASMHRHPDPHHESIRRMSQASVECFGKAIRHLQMPVEEVRIPYEGTTLPGYYYRSPMAEAKAPVMIIFNGRDAWAIQDKYLAEAGNRRGYHVMLVDGPGQGPVLRLQGLPFRHDWEHVVTPVVDYTLAIDGVDPARVGLMGLSMGGVLVPRAAAFEHRLKVCVANPGVVSWSSVTEAGIGAIVGKESLAWIDSDPVAFDRHLSEMRQRVPLLDWGIDDILWKHGETSPAQVIRELRKYDNSKTAGRIRCKMLMMDGEADPWSQSDQLLQLLKIPSDTLRFKAEDAGLMHCQTAANAIGSQRLYDWLDRNLKA